MRHTSIKTTKNYDIVMAKKVIDDMRNLIDTLFNYHMLLVKVVKGYKAPIDVFGEGTNLVTGYIDAALDGVYKLAFSNGKPRIKLSEDISKVTVPFRKQVIRIFDNDNNFAGADAIRNHSPSGTRCGGHVSTFVSS